MAKNTQPILKRCKTLGISPAVLGISKETNRKPKQARRKQSEYALQLNEKQKVKFIYGVLETPFRRYYEKAEKMEGKTGEMLLQLLERRLDRRRHHHRTTVPVPFQRLQKRRGETEIPRHELHRILRAVHPRQIEHEVRIAAPHLQLLRTTVHVILIDILDGHPFIPPRLPVTDVPQLGAKVPANEPFSPRNQYPHFIFV